MEEEESRVARRGEQVKGVCADERVRAGMYVVL